jgi:hypothetical protein
LRTGVWVGNLLHLCHTQNGLRIPPLLVCRSGGGRSIGRCKLPASCK